MKIITVVGARPQFIKAAAASRKLRERAQEILVHTGQHYDANMSDIFFKDLHIPKPDYNLGINGGSHSQMTAQMMIEIEKILLKEKPDAVLVYGDTNSTLAGALTAVKLHIPVCHVEAGIRTWSLSNPEEINRICADQVSTLLLTCTENNYNNLVNEGLGSRSEFVGDLMYDAFLYYKERVGNKEYKIKTLSGDKLCIPPDFYLLTCHREENTLKQDALYEIFKGMEQLDYPTIYPVHPRNRSRAVLLCEKYGFKNIVLAEPVDYFTSLYMVMNAKKIVTDSGGLQREAFFAQKQCVTVLDINVWPETTIDNRNQLCSAEADEIFDKLMMEQNVKSDYMPFGNGHAAEKIIQAILRM